MRRRGRPRSTGVKAPPSKAAPAHERLAAGERFAAFVVFASCSAFLQSLARGPAKSWHRSAPTRVIESPQVMSWRKSARASPGSATAATHRAPRVESGETSTSDEPYVDAERDGEGIAAAEAGHEAGYRGKKRRQDDARGAAVRGDRARHESHRAVDRVGGGDPGEKSAEELDPSVLLGEGHERAHAADHQDRRPGGPPQRRRLVGSAQGEEQDDRGHGREAHGEPKNDGTQRPRARSPRTSGAASARAAPGPR